MHNKMHYACWEKTFWGWFIKTHFYRHSKSTWRGECVLGACRTGGRVRWHHFYLFISIFIICRSEFGDVFLTAERLCSSSQTVILRVVHYGPLRTTETQTWEWMILSQSPHAKNGLCYSVWLLLCFFTWSIISMMLRLFCVFSIPGRDRPLE